jgi:peroxiredoxin
MRRRTVITLMLSAGANVAALADTPAARVGTPAPAFAVNDSEGRLVSSQGLLGKTVVLEWTNPECPYVDKHYGSGNMQALQREATANGVVWLTISSAAPGNMGYLDALEAAEMVATRKAAPTHLLLDHDGRMLTAYGVNVALTMAVIDAKGALAYFGAIDDKPTAKLSDIPGARNYVRDALAALAGGQPVKPAQTRPYGCVAR